MDKKIKVVLVHKGIWDMEKLSMPLACGYLKASAMEHPKLADAFDIEIVNFGGAHNIIDMIPKVLMEQRPDIIGFSVYGWNYHVFGRLATTFKQLNPDGWCIMGGPHVGNQAHRVFKEYPAVDLIANGEGELTFVELLENYLEGKKIEELGLVQGISFLDSLNTVVTTKLAPRIQDLSQIPSPFLTEAFPLTDENGEFLYDAVTMESNRGCPYKCSFCYWGGATGSRIHKFDDERIAKELELFGTLEVENICLADANFGMLTNDESFLDVLIGTRQKYGFPRNIIPSWAKNKGKRFYKIVAKMKQAGLTADFTLALQTLEDEALETSQRKNMKINDFEELCNFLNDNGMDAYAELIWQLPGETYESFLDGYDKVAKHVSRIATYNNLVLPNTHYSNEKEKYELVTFKGNDHDFESILSHNTMSYESNVKMHHFLFWARTIAELMFLRNIFAPLRELAGISQSQVLLSLNGWVETCEAPEASALRKQKYDVVDNLDVTRIGRPIRYLYSTQGLDTVFRDWWSGSILPRVPQQLKAFFSELFEYDYVTRPVFENMVEHRNLDTVEIKGEHFYRSQDMDFSYDIPSIVRQCKEGKSDIDVEKSGSTMAFYFRPSFENYVDNHEVVLRYTGRTLDALLSEIQNWDNSSDTIQEHRHVAAMPDVTLQYVNVD